MSLYKVQKHKFRIKQNRTSWEGRIFWHASYV